MRASIVMDIDKLHAKIRTLLELDPEAVIGLHHAKNSTNNRWTFIDGLLRLDNRIYVLNYGDLRLHILRYHHDHILAAHFGQNRTLELIRREYTWLKIRDFVRDYVSSCTICGWNKSRRHRPYGLLKPLPVPIRPWDSISMDFIEQLPTSDGYTVILVIVD